MHVPSARRSIAALTLGAFFCCVPAPVLADGDGKLLATGGVTNIEGSAGGGLVPWALIAGYDTKDQTDATVFYTHIALPAIAFDAAGFAIGIKDRLELSYARQSLALDNSITTPIAAGLNAPVGFLDGTRLNQDVFGVKIKLFGNAVFSPANSVWPQVALGAQFKANNNFSPVPATFGAKSTSGTDIYLAATKVILAGAGGYNLLLNATVRETKENLLGFLGYGGPQFNTYQPQFEGSAAVFMNPQTAVGAEYRTNTDFLPLTKSSPYQDLFVAYFPSKHLSLTAAYVNLGNVPAGATYIPSAVFGGPNTLTGITKQNASGLYLSAQVGI
jgi:hypothetical protein